MSSRLYLLSSLKSLNYIDTTMNIKIYYETNFVSDDKINIYMCIIVMCCDE